MITAADASSRARHRPPLLLQLLDWSCPACKSSISLSDLQTVLGPTASTRVMQSIARASLEALHTHKWMIHCPHSVNAAIFELIDATLFAHETPARSILLHPHKWQLQVLTLAQLQHVLRTLGMPVSYNFDRCANALIDNTRGRALMELTCSTVSAMALVYRAYLIIGNRLPESHLCSSATFSNGPASRASSVTSTEEILSNKKQTNWGTL